MSASHSNFTTAFLVIHLVQSLILLLLMYVYAPTHPFESGRVCLVGAESFLWPPIILYALWWWYLIPYHIARVRDHHSRVAIAVTAGLGILTYGISWVVALVWSFTDRQEV